MAVDAVRSVNMAGYASWVKPILELAPTMFPGYAEALALIAQRKEAMRQADIHGSIGKTAGWSPNKNFKLEFEMPYEAVLLFKAAFGRDALQNPKVKKLIHENHPEFSFRLRR